MHMTCRLSHQCAPGGANMLSRCLAITAHAPHRVFKISGGWEGEENQ